ncbi:hypothetical protein D1007_38619 [Hordeum vulgare]|nr:hypothetical protein D1007_38619 [Hordeum vulgare]
MNLGVGSFMELLYRFSQPALPEPVPDLRGPEEKEKEEESIPSDSQPESQDGEEFEIPDSRSQVSDEQIFPTPDLPNVPDIDNTDSHTGPLHESQRTVTPWPQRLILHILFIAVDHVRFSEPGVLFYTKHGGLIIPSSADLSSFTYVVWDGLDVYITIPT